MKGGVTSNGHQTDNQESTANPKGRWACSIEMAEDLSEETNIRNPSDWLEDREPRETAGISLKFLKAEVLASL